MTDKLGRSGDAPRSAFLECQYYEGGLRPLTVTATGDRPDWAPEYDWVGFRDEASLRGTDLAIEIAKFAHRDGVVSWIGVYRHSPDKVYGDRQNHAGVGVWLLNSFPLNPIYLVEDLEKLLGKFETGPDESFVTSARAFLKDFLGEYLGPYRQMQPPTHGIQAARNPAHSTVLFRIDRRQDTWSKRIEDLFYRAFFLTLGKDESRVLILLSGQNGQNAGPPVGLPEYQSDGFVADFFSALPEAFAAHASTVDRLENDIAASRKVIEEQDTRIDSLESRLLSTTRDLETLKTDYDELRDSISSNDELTRFNILKEGISGLRVRTAGVEDIVRGLRSSIVGDLRAELRGSLETLQRASPSPSRPAERLDQRGPVSSRTHQAEYHWGKVAALCSVVAVFVGALVYLVYWAVSKFGA